MSSHKTNGSLARRGSLFFLIPLGGAEMRQEILNFLRDDQGAELAEYAVAVALLVAISLIVYKTLGSAINDENAGTGAKVTSAQDNFTLQ
jgi:Flp pilus assembly pilin Flp